MNETNNTTADTILSQLGGTGRLAAMLGARLFAADATSLQFRFAAKATNKANSIRVVLDPTDTYTVEFWRIGRGFNVDKVASVSDVYAESLRDVIETSTGLRLSL